MDTLQERSRGRIVPFPQPQHPTAPPVGKNDSGTQIDRVATDQLLEMFALADPLPGEHSGLTHMRAVSIGASSGAFYPHTPTELVPETASRLGITSIELMLQTASEYQPDFIEVVAAKAKHAGVRIHAIHTMHSLHPMLDAYPRRAEEGRALFQQGIEAAAALGAKVLVWHGARRQEVATDEGWERFIALTHDLASACGKAGVTLAIENVSWCALALVRNVVNFATRLDDIGTSEEIGFVFDPFQAVEAGANPFMMLAAMGNRVVDVHVSDYREDDASARHLVPGDGDLPWSALIRAIAGSGYSGPMMIEGPLGTDDEAISRIREKLNPLIRSVFPFSPDGNQVAPTDDGAADIESSSITLLSTTTPPIGLLQGIELFNQREFYKQHEVIEHEWHAERGPIRRLYQGILQIGVGFHHALNGNHRGAILLLTNGIEKTADFTPSALGIETGRLVIDAQRCLDQLVELGPDRIRDFDPSSIPTISLTND